MAERIKLPQVTSFSVNGFEPIYSAPIELKMGAGPYVILGGNGLGKTTLIQAVVYALAGGLDDKVEDVKALRWSHSYFRGRLSPNQISTAYVEVEFRLGKKSISVRRGFRGSQVVAVRDGRGNWVEDNAAMLFGQLLREYGGYLESSDFAFVVHRLLYLPESRRLIAWDTDAQIRLLMLLNQDVAVEREFRENRAQLKFLDSKRRHIRVALNRAAEEIASLLEYEESESDAETAENEEGDETEDSEEDRLPTLASELSEIAQKRIDAESRMRTALSDLSRTSDTVDKLRQEIEAAEAGLVDQFLAETEKDHNLPLAKLIESAICPACGQRHLGLAELARKHLRAGCCALCGSEELHHLNPALSEFRRTLEVEIRSQQAFEEIVRMVRFEVDTLRQQEIEAQARVSQIRYKRSVVAIVERNLPQMTVDNLRELKRSLEDEEADAEIQANAIHDKLTEDYEKFRNKMDSRMEELRAIYREFATAFLGLPCELDEVERGGLMELKLFVPRFDNALRDEEAKCSEAQRFFLDIAFRMALIDVAGGDRGTATFICETPETALDVSYIDNVVSMFMSFAKRQHNILLTANIQAAGIAENMLARLPKDVRMKHVVNLLELGRLSAVQKSASSRFKSILRRIETTPRREME